MPGFTQAIDGLAGSDGTDPVVTLQSVKFELGYPDGEDADDADLRRKAQSAVSAVSTDANLPLLIQSVALDFQAPSRVDEAIIIRDLFVRTLRAENPVMYAIDDDDSMFVQAATVGLIVEPGNGNPEGFAVIAAPAGGWPEDATALRVFYNRGIPTTWQGLDQARSAILQRIRMEVDGIMSISGTRHTLYSRMVQSLSQNSPSGLMTIA